ncbi:ADM_collapsed_G0057270.mRNA.1.CDS.1 [Saccharomyces cerevisiae]|nr:ADM_collapsed_G0057270.mRNA.1.CDS.1 [Saccharomyces cerevisiae]
MTDPFTKINTRGAEDPKVLINDQLSTISMILRNISFSDNNSRIMSRNFYHKMTNSHQIPTIGT